MTAFLDAPPGLPNNLRRIRCSPFEKSPFDRSARSVSSNGTFRQGRLTFTRLTRFAHLPAFGQATIKSKYGQAFSRAGTTRAMRGAPQAVRIEPWISAGRPGAAWETGVRSASKRLGLEARSSPRAARHSDSIWITRFPSPAARIFKPRKNIGNARDAIPAFRRGEPESLFNQLKQPCRGGLGHFPRALRSLGWTAPLK